MKTPTPGLRRLFNKSHAVAKVYIVVPPGDELVVSEDVAAQLLAEDAAFIAAEDVDQKHLDAIAANKAAKEAEAEEAAAVEELPPAPADAAETVDTPAPRKVAAKKTAKPKKRT